MQVKLSLRNISLAWIVAGTTATLGLLVLLSGIGLTVAILTTRQGLLQFVTAAALMLAGGANLSASRPIGRQKIRGVAISAAATISLTLFLVLTSNSSELIAIHQLYLFLLLGFAYRDRVGFMHASASAC